MNPAEITLSMTFITILVIIVLVILAAGLLTRDGGLVLFSLLTMLGLPVLAWQAGVGG